VYLVLGLGFGTFFSNLSLFGFYRLGLTTEVLGFYFTIGGIFALGFRYTLFPRMLKKLKSQGMIYFGFILFIITYLIVGNIFQPWMFAAILLLNNMSGGCIWGLLDTRISELVDPRGMGTITGINSMLYQTASIIGPIISGWVLTFWPVTTYGLIPAGFMIIAFAIVVGLRSKIFYNSAV
jgi:MFS family permease